jgi:hypothetical protein
MCGPAKASTLSHCSMISRRQGSFGFLRDHFRDDRLKRGACEVEHVGLDLAGDADG